MPQTNTNNNESSPSDGSSSSSSKGDSDPNKKPDKDPPEKDRKPPPLKSNDSDKSPENSPPPPPPPPQSPSPSSPQSPPPPPQKSASPPPSPQSPPPSPPLSPPPSPSPSPSPPPPKPKPSPSPPPSTSPPPPPPWHNDSSSSPHHKHPQKQSSPIRPQFQAPPPHKSPSSPPSHHSNSNDSPPPFSTGSKSNHDDGGGGGSSPANSRGSSSPSSSPGDNAAKYFGYTLAGVFFLALVFLVFLMFIRRKRGKGGVHPANFTPSPYHKVLVKSDSDAHYYVQQPQFSKEKSYENGINIGGNMKNFGDPLDSSQPINAQIIFRYDTIMEITDSFSSQKLIGEGGFGCVYKGYLPDGKPVAVKRLKASSVQGDREFRSEVEIISRVHHRHLVSLVGYCMSDHERVLIYEFVPNGTLYHHLHGSGMPVLDWDKRLKIAIGAAKGLAYLHEDCSQKIIHRDIKSANILLDYAFEAQVADFGLAKLHDAALTHVSTRVIGTFGYMAPEYATSGKLTDRSDVFSFGVVLLELLTGRKPVDESQPLGDESVVEWARPHLLRAMESRDFSELIDPRLEKKFVVSEVFRMVESAVACIRHSAPRRPRMVQVVRTLDSGDEISDLSNGVKYGDSTLYDSGQYDKDIMQFRRMGNDSLGYSDLDMDSREYSFSTEMSGFQHASVHSNYSGESDYRPFNRHRGDSTG